MVNDWGIVVRKLAAIGPPTSYIGFSMGAIFGLPTVRSMPSITATVLVAGGIPGQEWTDDPDIHEILIDAAEELDSDDELFPPDNSQLLFDSLAGCSKRLTFSSGGHDDWDPELLDDAATFISRFG